MHLGVSHLRALSAWSAAAAPCTPRGEKFAFDSSFDGSLWSPDVHEFTIPVIAQVLRKLQRKKRTRGYASTHGAARCGAGGGGRRDKGGIP